MDDRHFDEGSAAAWIAVVESEGGRIREHDIYPRLRAWAVASGGTEFLEIGCGQGACAEPLAVDGVRYTGVEPSAFLRERAETLHARHDRRFLQGDAYALPLSDECFDAACSVALWHLLSRPHNAADELARVLKPGGHFLIITAHAAAADYWLNPHDELHLHSIEVMTDSLIGAGLVVEGTETFREGRFILLRGLKA